MLRLSYMALDRRLSQAGAHVSRVSAALLLLSAASVRAQPAPSDAPALQDAVREAPLDALLRAHTDALGRPCDFKQLASQGELRFAACGAAGLWTVRVRDNVEATLLSMQDLGGAVTGFFSAEGRVWVKISSERAQPLESPQLQPGAAGMAVSPAPSPSVPAASPPARRAGVLRRAPEPVPAARGRALGSEDEDVTVELEDAALPVGTRIAFASPARDERAPIVGQVVSSRAGRARVAIGTNEHVSSGSLAMATSAPVTASLIAPPRAAGYWELGLVARPFLVLDDLGFGAVLDAQVGYRMHAPFHFRAALAPLAFATARSGATLPFAAVLSAAYDARLFEAGLGIGAQSVNDPGFGLDRGSGTTIAQYLRIGAVDGLQLELETYVVLFHSRFEFSTLRVRAQVPLGTRTWLHAAGGGGNLSIATGEVGLRVLTSGNGGAGSLFLTSLVGWAGVLRGCNALVLDGSCREISYAGPMLGVGAELRR